MRYFLFILIALSAFAKEDEAAKLVETSKARRATWKTFVEKVSAGNLCEPRDYPCFLKALTRIPDIHPEDLIASKNALEIFYLRSIKDDPIPCGDTCQHSIRAWHVSILLEIFLNYNTEQTKIYNFKDSSTVRATRIRAYMDLSAFGNMRKHLDYLKTEFSKIDFSKVTIKHLQKKDWYEDAFARIESGSLFSRSVLCHLHPGTMVYDEIAEGNSKVDKKYSQWLKEFDQTGRKACVDSTPIEFRGMDLSTRQYYDQQTQRKLAAIKCGKGDYACIRKHLRNMPIRYAKDVNRVAVFLSRFMSQDFTPNCDETCKAESLLKASQTFITYLSQFDRQKLGSTMDWKKFPEERFLTITEDVSIYESIVGNFGDVLIALGQLDPAKIKDAGLRSELKSIGQDVSDFVAGKMLKDSVICTMEPWTAAYDKYMTPYSQPKRNKKFEKGFLNFKEKVCK